MTLYVRCTGRGALNLARVRRDVLSGDRYYQRSGDENEKGVERHELPRYVVCSTRAALTCGARKRVERERCIRFRPVHYFYYDALPSPSALIPSETRRVSFCTRSTYRMVVSHSPVINIDYVPNVHARGSSR